jgi:hypothetical protein
MAINFPGSPTNGQTFTSGALTWSYSTSVGAWQVVPAGAGGGGASVFSSNVGNGSATTFNVAHNLAKTYVIPSVRENSTGYYVYPDLKYTSLNHIVLEFNTAPTTNQYTVIVLG